MNVPEVDIAPNVNSIGEGQGPAPARPEKRKTMQRGSGGAERKSKKDRLIRLLSKPNGVRASVIAEMLGWQAHTVRAAISRLRQQGLPIATSKSPKTGEIVYVIVAASGAVSSDEAGT
ncbi:DUF3489 domain-containing protein [Phyllobacterium phragmitis]|uniref:DUF3489 domain-containing protein n=1 Tax=Phyllobacterium phragmitis TaxID=2670329 RepID=A0ABQ0GWN2_9HYPH